MISKIESVVPKIIIGLIIAAAAIFLFTAAQGDSAIFDETAHVVSGYTYLKHLDYRFNPEHPPLIKMLAGLPLLFQNLQFPTTGKDYWGGINEQWSAGNQFLYQSGNDPNDIMTWARIGPIIITLLLIIAVYLFARELIGRWWALLPAFLTAFSSIILAHGHYVTTDVGAALGMLISIRYFLRWLSNQSFKNFVIAGLAFGFAQAIKFSGILLIPYFFLIAIIFAVSQSEKIKNLIRHTLLTAVIMATGYLLVVYPLYTITTLNYPMEKQIADTEVLLQNFSVQSLANATVKLASNPITRPFSQYLLGVLMVAQRSDGGNNAFFLGELSSKGWWYYFPLIYLMKESLSVLILLAAAGFLGLLRIAENFRYGLFGIYRKFLEYFDLKFTEFSLIIFIATYWAFSISSPLNIGVRHLVPTLPLIYILAAGSIKKWFSAQSSGIVIAFWDRLTAAGNVIFNFWIKTLIISVLTIWLIIETAIAAPYFLSYFNETAGGRFNGFQYATDSNFDWGQDLKRLQLWVKNNLPPGEKIAVDYFGGGDPRYFLGDQFEPWWSAKGNPKDSDINWLAISVNTLQGALARPAPDFYRNPADEYRWLEQPLQPAAKAGTAIFIYKL